MSQPAKTAKTAETEEATEATEAAPAGKSKKKLLIIVGALVVLLGGGGAGAWMFMKGAAPAGEEEKHAEPPKAPVFLPLETFTVNLQGGEQYLQTDITLQVSDEKQVEEIKLQMPRVRSRLLSLLSSKQAGELVTAGDKKKLTQEIMGQVNQPFNPHGKPQQVVDVLFTSFVIQ